MLKVHDIRESRVYQEALQEGEGIGMEKGMEKGIAIAIERMAASNISVDEIARILKLNVDVVRHVLANSDPK
jgi:predicted transposase YdaD